MLKKLAVAAAVLLIGVAAATSKPASPTSKPTAPRSAGDGLEPIATIQDIMQSLVDPSADSLWAAVSSTTTSSGIEDRQPRTDEDWKAVRRYAVALVEAPNLLLLPGRLVSQPKGQLEDSHVVGILRPEEIAKKIAADRGAFIERAQALRLAAKEALAAIDARDVGRLFEAGGKLDTACEDCHVKYWYPNDTRPPPPANVNLLPLPPRP